MIGEVLGEVSVPEGFSPDSVKQLILRPKSAIATWPEFNQTDDSFKESVMQVRNKIKIIRKEHPEAFMKFTFVPCRTSGFISTGARRAPRSCLLSTRREDWNLGGSTTA